MYHRLSYVLMVVTVLLCACSPVKTFVETSAASGMSGHTYAFVPLSDEGVDQASAILHDEISQRIHKALQQRGYTPDTNNPQLLVAFNILTNEQRKEVTKSADSYGGYNHMWANTYGGGWWPPMNNARYKEIRVEKTGILIVDFVSASERELVWRGVGSGPVNDPEERFETSYKIIKKLSRKFPTATSSSDTD
ncbi:MAG: DUF4136 domain-containing protein [Tunicatimonas sp.]